MDCLILVTLLIPHPNDDIKQYTRPVVKVTNKRENRVILVQDKPSEQRTGNETTSRLLRKYNLDREVYTIDRENRVSIHHWMFSSV